MPRAPSEKVTQAEKLFNDGMAMVEIAKKLEVSDGTVRSWKNRTVPSEPSSFLAI